jgi:predicted CXXCH cytochrome family protein
MSVVALCTSVQAGQVWFYPKEVNVMKKIFVAVVTIVTFAGASFAADVKDRMEFPAKNGKVTFYHTNHVNEVRGDCKVCHTQTPGKIKGFGEDYAHKICIDCHKKADGPEGPTKCDECHKK